MVVMPSYLTSQVATDAVAPTKPDLRAGLIVVALLAVASGQLHSQAGSAVGVFGMAILAVALGLAARVWPLLLVYLALQFVYAISMLGAAIPALPYLGITVGLILRGFPVYLAVWVVFVRLPMGEVMATLEALRVPRSFAIVFGVVYRYVPTLLGELAVIRTANRLRHIEPGWRRWLRHPLRQVENLMVPLLMRSGKIADELSAVALCKGLDADAARSALVRPRFQPADAAIVAGTLGLIAAAVATDLWLGGRA